MSSTVFFGDQKLPVFPGLLEKRYVCKGKISRQTSLAVSSIECCQSILDENQIPAGRKAWLSRIRADVTCGAVLPTGMAAGARLPRNVPEKCGFVLNKIYVALLEWGITSSVVR